MKLSQFQFNLPAGKIATEPPRWRDECKLMVLHKDTGEIEHRLFKDIIDYFGKGDTFVLNDTKVFPARLYGNKEKTGADIEVFLLRELNREQRLWRKPSARKTLWLRPMPFPSMPLTTTDRLLSVTMKAVPIG